MAMRHDGGELSCCHMLSHRAFHYPPVVLVLWGVTMRERMPRLASTEENDNTIVPPKRPRRAPRKRATPAVEEEAVIDVGREDVAEEKPVTRTPRRKAPTRRVVEQAPVVSNDTPTRASAPRRSRLPLIIMSAVFFAGVGVSALLGFSDKGAIDVASRIQEQSALQAGNSGEGNNNGQPIPVQNTPVDVPNGGLRGRGADATPPPPPEVPATTTATSSDETAEENTATSTQAAPEEETEAVAEEASDTTTEAAATPAQ